MTAGYPAPAGAGQYADANLYTNQNADPASNCDVHSNAAANTKNINS